MRYSYYSNYNRINFNTILIISAIVVLFFIICMWRIFTKAGRSGWKCLIPIYNVYVEWDIAWDGGKFLVLFFGGLVISMVTGLISRLGRFGIIVGALGSLAWSIYAIVLSIKMAIRMAHRFGKSTEFGVIGLWFFSIIGYLILAFGGADYNVNRDLGDGILRSDVDIQSAKEEKSEYWNRISEK